MWKVPVDHEIFERLNPAQWLWYHYNFIKDEEEQFESSRDAVEYMASFVEPEVVQKIQSIRKQSKHTDQATASVNDKEFMANVSQMFGRSIEIDGKKLTQEDLSDIQPNSEIVDVINNLSYYQKSKDPSLNYKHWAQLDLE